MREPFQRLSDWRARIGLLSIIVISLPYTDGLFLLTDRMSSAMIGFFLSGAIVGLSAAFFRWKKTGRADGVARAKVDEVLRRVLAMIGVTALLLILADVLPTHASEAVLASVILPGAWFEIFSTSMQWYALRWVYGISDANALLGPAATAIAAMVADLVLNQPEPRPGGVQQVLKFSALGSVLLLAGCEAIFVGHRRKSALSPRLPGPPSRTQVLFCWATGEPSRLAIASIIMVFLLPPVGILLALIDLLRIRGNSQQGAGLPVGTLVIAAAWPVAYSHLR